MEKEEERGEERERERERERREREREERERVNKCLYILTSTHLTFHEPVKFNGHSMLFFFFHRSRLNLPLKTRKEIEP